MGLVNLSIKPILNEGGEPSPILATLTIDGIDISNFVRSIFIEKRGGSPGIARIELIAKIDVDELPVEIQEVYLHVPEDTEAA